MRALSSEAACPGCRAPLTCGTIEFGVADGLTDRDIAEAIAALCPSMPADEAIASVRSIASNLAVPTKRARQEAERLGIDFSTDAARAAGGIARYLRGLSEAGTLNEARMFDSREARAGASILGSDIDVRVSQPVERDGVMVRAWRRHG